MAEDGPRIALPAGPHARRMGRPVDTAITTFARMVVRQRALDSVVTEAVRLRCARVHDCRFCQSVRLKEAADDGFDAEADAAIDQYETSGLDERIKVALRLTDAMIESPVEVSAALRSQVLEHFSSEQVVEMVFDIIKWSSQKSLVALRLEPPMGDGASSLQFDDHGDPILGIAAHQ